MPCGVRPVVVPCHRPAAGIGSEQGGGGTIHPAPDEGRGEYRHTRMGNQW